MNKKTKKSMRKRRATKKSSPKKRAVKRSTKKNIKKYPKRKLNYSNRKMLYGGMDDGSMDHVDYTKNLL